MNCVYVGNLPPDIRIKDIDDFFKPFGRLVYVDVKHSDNQRIAYAYVQFENSRNAFNAVKARHGYDYEGYTLQLRLMENEVRNRRSGTPPFDNYDFPNNNFGMNGNYVGGNNRQVENFSNSPLSSNTNGSWSNNRRNDLQQDMIQYPTSNRSNFLQENQEFNVDNRFNMQANMNENYSDSNRSGMLQNLNYANRSDMSTPNMNFPHYSDMSQQNMMNYSNVNRNMGQQNMMNFSDTNCFNISQQGITDYSNCSKMPEQINMIGNNSDNSWSNGNNFGNWDSGSRGNHNFNDECNQIFNQNEMPMNEYVLRRLSGAGRKWYRRYIENGMPHEEALAKALDRRTVPYFRGDNADNTSWNGECNENIDENDEFDVRGLSGAGRKWYKRYIDQGMSPVVARNKALERRRLPYLRGDDPKRNQSNVSQNMALENIGNTIISLLSTNSVGNSNSMDLGNKGIQRSRSADIQNTVQTTHNAVSDSQYYKSLAALRKLGSKRTLSADDRLSKRYHLQIVKDFRIAIKSLKNKEENIIKNIRDSEVIAELMRNTKKKLLSQARQLDYDKNPKKRFGGAQKKRFKILVDMGFPSIEASALAVLTTETLRPLIDLKKEYNLSTKKTDFLQGDKISPDIPKVVVYNNDLRYIKQYKNEKLTNLSMRIRIALRKCVIRVHNYERENKLNLTQSKFIFSILNENSQYDAINKRKENKKRNRSRSKKYTENKNSASTTSAGERAVNDTKAKIKNEDENCATDSKNTVDDIDNQDNIDITEEYEDDDDCYVVENPENENATLHVEEDNDIEIKSEHN